MALLERMVFQNLSGFYEKIPVRCVKPTFIKDHLGSIYDTEEPLLLHVSLNLALCGFVRFTALEAR